jgi:NAD(P)H-hydrate epimerase
VLGIMASTVVPTVTVAQMREVDRLMIDEAGISLVQMMENAGRALATVVRAEIGGTADRRHVAVLAGSGGNGGGGLVAARRLACWGATVTVWTTHPPEHLTGVAPQQMTAATASGVHHRLGPPGEADFDGMDAVVDAVIGYSLAGHPTGVALRLVEAAHRARDRGLPVVSLDVPSGLDPDTGLAPGAAVRASHTVTLALPKPGLLAAAAAEYVGALSLADISVPAWVYTRVGVDPGTPFATTDLVRLR